MHAASGKASCDLKGARAPYASRRCCRAANCPQAFRPISARRSNLTRRSPSPIHTSTRSPSSRSSCRSRNPSIPRQTQIVQMRMQRQRRPLGSISASCSSLAWPWWCWFCFRTACVHSSRSTASALTPPPLPPLVPLITLSPCIAVVVAMVAVVTAVRTIAPAQAVQGLRRLSSIRTLIQMTCISNSSRSVASTNRFANRSCGDTFSSNTTMIHSTLC